MFDNKTVTPNTKPKLAILDPTTFPKAKSGEPSKAALILTISSGADVAKETTVKPITTLDTLSRKESATADFKSQLPPKINKVSPNAIKIKSCIHLI